MANLLVRKMKILVTFAHLLKIKFLSPKTSSFWPMFFIFYINLIIVCIVPSHVWSAEGNRFLKYAACRRLVIPLRLGVMIEIWKEMLIGIHKQKFCGSNLWLANQFSDNLNRNLKISSNHGGITDLRDLRENSTNI